MARSSWELGLLVEVGISVCLVSTAIFGHLSHNSILVLTDKYATPSSLPPCVTSLYYTRVVSKLKDRIP